MIRQLRRWLTRDATRTAADEAKVLRVIAEHPQELSAHTIGIFAGFPPGRANLVLGRLMEAKRVTSRWRVDADKRRIVYRLADEAATEGAHRAES